MVEYTGGSTWASLALHFSNLPWPWLRTALAFALSQTMVAPALPEMDHDRWMRQALEHDLEQGHEPVLLDPMPRHPLTFLKHAAAVAAGTAVGGAPWVEVGSYCGRSTIWLGDAAERCDPTLARRGPVTPIVHLVATELTRLDVPGRLVTRSRDFH